LGSSTRLRIASSSVFARQPRKLAIASVIEDRTVLRRK